MVAAAASTIAALLALGLATTVAAAPGKLPPITLDTINAGLAVAPGLVSQTGLDCQVSNARLIGEDHATKSVFYELACDGAEGFVIGEPAKGSKFQRVVYSCLEAATSKSALKYGASCRLPENEDPKEGIAPLVAKYAPSCEMTDARAIGHTDTGTALEVACRGGAGYVVQASFPLSDAKPATFNPCAGIRPDMTLKCALTDAAANTGYVASLVVKAGKPCEVRGYRFVGFGVGINDKGDEYFEVACARGDGWILDVDASGGVYPAPCAEAGYIAGGCKLVRAATRR